MLDYEDRYHHVKMQPLDERSIIQMRSEKFYAERNVYLTGFTLFLSIVLNRFVVVIFTLATAEEKQAVLVKQANETNKAYMTLLDETEKLKKKSEEAEKAIRDLDTLKSQSKNMAIEYDRLLAEHAALQRSIDQESPSNSKKSQ